MGSFRCFLKYTHLFLEPLLYLCLLLQPTDIVSLPDLDYVQPFFFFYSQTPLNQLFELKRDICSYQWLLNYFFPQLFLCSASLQWRLAMEKLIDEDAERPDVSFRSIDVVNQSFRAHVEWTSNTNISEGLSSFDGKAEISQFVVSILQEDIRKFEIPVHNAQVGQVLQCAEYRKYNLFDLMLGQYFVVFKESVQISAFAVLCDYVAVIDAKVDIQAFDDVWVAEVRQHCSFAVQQPGCDFTLEVCNSDLFDCDGCVMGEVGGSIHLAEAAFPYFVGQIEGIVLYFFDQPELLELF